MRLLVVSLKECWKDGEGRWLSYGGFPAQMRGLASLFEETTLLVVSGNTRDGGIPLPPGARVVAVDRPVGTDLRRKLSVVGRISYYVRAIRDEARQADVVHVPLPGDVPFLGLLVAVAMRKRVLGRYGGSWAATAQTTIMNRVTRAAMRLLADRNVMLATGEGSSRPAAAMDWIFSTALSRAELDAIVPVTDRGLSDPPRIVYAGRLSEEKGVANLVEALSILKKDGLAPLPLVTLAGDGPQRRTLEELVQARGCGDQVVFAGQLARPSLSRCLATADFCVQPSLTEGFSKAWLDALAHGLPVLSSDAGAARSVVGADGERGWVVPPGDPRLLADALRNVLTSSIDWSGLRRRCRNYVQHRTLEAWTVEIGQACVRRWGLVLAEGKLWR